MIDPPRRCRKKAPAQPLGTQLGARRTLLKRVGPALPPLPDWLLESMWRQHGGDAEALQRELLQLHQQRAANLAAWQAEEPSSGSAALAVGAQMHADQGTAGAALHDDAPNAHRPPGRPTREVFLELFSAQLPNGKRVRRHTNLGRPRPAASFVQTAADLAALFIADSQAIGLTPPAWATELALSEASAKAQRLAKRKRGPGGGRPSAKTQYDIHDERVADLFRRWVSNPQARRGITTAPLAAIRQAAAMVLALPLDQAPAPHKVVDAIHRELWRWPSLTVRSWADTVDRANLRRLLKVHGIWPV